MSALKFAKHAFSREKPHSSITDWVDILTGPSVQEEAYDGIPELVDSINLQSTGPFEASRALRKKLKHGSAHQQYRAIVLLKALVENCGPKFQTSFADNQLTDTIRNMVSDSSVDLRVRKKLDHVLVSWHVQFKDDPSMALVAGLRKQYQLYGHSELIASNSSSDRSKAKWQTKQQEEAPERDRRSEEKSAKPQKKKKTKKRVPFDFERDKHKVLSSIADASQASNNLVNAVILVNPDTDNVLTNERVQACLSKAKQAGRLVVRYIQLVENEELIGTLIETNERMIKALELYDQHALPARNEDPTDAIVNEMAASNLNGGESEASRLEEQEHSAAERGQQLSDCPGSSQQNSAFVHPDLQDLTFGPIGASSAHLQAPLRPSGLSEQQQQRDQISHDLRGSLSDFSDYESSDEEGHQANSSSRDTAHFVASHNEQVNGSHVVTDNLDEDPFADPFADESPVARTA